MGEVSAPGTEGVQGYGKGPHPAVGVALFFAPLYVKRPLPHRVREEAVSCHSSMGNQMVASVMVNPHSSTAGRPAEWCDVGHLHSLTGELSPNIMGMAAVRISIPEELIEKAREALNLEQELFPTAVVRKALIEAIGDENMNHILYRGRPRKDAA